MTDRPLQSNVSAQITYVVSDQKWTIELNRIDELPDIQIERVADLDELDDLLTRQECTFSLVESEVGNPFPVARLIARYNTRRPRHRFVVLGKSDLMPIARVFRELGAIDVATTVADMPRIANLIECHRLSLPRQTVTLEQAILDSLPWQKYANPGDI